MIGLICTSAVNITKWAFTAIEWLTIEFRNTDQHIIASTNIRTLHTILVAIFTGRIIITIHKNIKFNLWQSGANNKYKIYHIKIISINLYSIMHNSCLDCTIVYWWMDSDKELMWVTLWKLLYLFWVQLISTKRFWLPYFLRNNSNIVLFLSFFSCIVACSWFCSCNNNNARYFVLFSILPCSCLSVLCPYCFIVFLSCFPAHCPSIVHVLWLFCSFPWINAAAFIVLNTLVWRLHIFYSTQSLTQ